MEKLRLKIPPVIYFLTMIFASYVVHHNVDGFRIDWMSNGIVVKMLLVCGLFLGLISLFQFVKQKTSVNPHKPQNSSKLVQNGVYRFTRNPMYLSLLLFLIAYVLKMGVWLNVIFVIMFVWVMNKFQIIPEEEILESKFGEDFLRYKSNVRRWF